MADIDLVSTTEVGGEWFQIHDSHTHDGLNPHTHYPEVNVAPNGRTSVVRRYRATTAEDYDFADRMVRSGRMRQRLNRNDKGGTYHP